MLHKDQFSQKGHEEKLKIIGGVVTNHLKLCGFKIREAKQCPLILYENVDQDLKLQGQLSL